MRPGEEEVGLVEELLRRKLGERFPRQSRERAQFDRQIGKKGTGWTGKFLRRDPKAGTPTLQTLLAVLTALGISPGDFFGEAFQDSYSLEKSRLLQFVEANVLVTAVRPIAEQAARDTVEELLGAGWRDRGGGNG